jgi:hypothetical protein
MQQGLVDCLLITERTISSASSGDWFDLRRFLRFEREYTHLAHLPLGLQDHAGATIASLTHRAKGLLSNLLMLYRIVDIAAALACHPTHPQRYERSSGFMMPESIPVGTIFPLEFCT